MPQSTDAEFDIPGRPTSRCFRDTEVCRLFYNLWLYTPHASSRRILMVLYTLIIFSRTNRWVDEKYLINFLYFLRYIQELVVQASYWHDPLREDEYRKKNIFLADINNENDVNVVCICCYDTACFTSEIIEILIGWSNKVSSNCSFVDLSRQEYKQNLQKLQSIVFVKFENDTMVDPVESEWFGFYKPGQAEEVQKLQESKLYQEVNQSRDRLKISIGESVRYTVVSSSGPPRIARDGSARQDPLSFATNRSLTVHWRLVYREYN